MTTDNRLPDVTLLQHLLDLEGTKIVWKATRRNATVPGLFGTPDPVVLGWCSLDARAVQHALVTGQWPDAALDRPEPHIRRGHFEMAWRLMSRNLKRLEIEAA